MLSNEQHNILSSATEKQSETETVTQELGAIALTNNSLQAEQEKLDKDNLVFVFPVNDAESLTIKNMLEENEVAFYNTDQKWGASWSNAEDSIAKKIEDVPSDKKVFCFGLSGEPSNSRISQLNNVAEDGTKKSDLETVAEMLGVELTTEQKFVVANNYGYIPAMNELGKELGLSKEETISYIKKINSLEEEGQGITEYDRDLAHKAVEEAYIYDERLIWVTIPKFSAMREVTNELYALGKYQDLAYNTVSIESPGEEARVVVFSNSDVLEKVNKEIEESGTWKFEKNGSGYWGIQINGDDEKFNEVTETIKTILEDKVLGYHRLIEQKDINSSKTYEKGVQIHHINNGGAFRRTIEEAHDKNDHAAFLCMDYSANDYMQMDMIIVNAGAAGIAVKNDGDIVSVFKNPQIAEKDNISKINRALVLEAIKSGGKKLDCFDGFLPKMYARAGMVPVCKLKFNDKFAPEDWNYERDGRPDVIFMAHCGDSMEDIIRKYDSDEYPDPKEQIKNIPYVSGYAEAGILVEKYLAEHGTAKGEQEEKLNEARRKYVFLLGGHDLEMNQIRKILQKNDVDFVDANLSWGAKIEDYYEKSADGISRPGIVAGYKMFEHKRRFVGGDDSQFVSVELDGASNIETSQPVIDVNHHGSRAGEKASILQVLDLLGIEPTMEDLLIAANDSGFIPALEKMGATQEEIAEIRRRDRASQGVTEEEERISEEAVNNRETDGRLTTVKIPFTHSSPVSDRLYGKSDQLLIVEETNKGLALDFSGDGALAKALNDRFGGYSGGSGLGKEGENAYWGFPSDGGLTKEKSEEIQAFIKEKLK